MIKTFTIYCISCYLLLSLIFPAYAQNSLLLTKSNKIDVTSILEELEKKDFYGNKIVYVPLDILLQYAIVFLNSIQIANLNQKIAESQHEQNFENFDPKLITSLENQQSLAIKSLSETETSFVASNSNNFNSTFVKKTTSGIDYSIGINNANTKTSNYILDNDNMDVSAQGETKTNLLNASILVKIPLSKNLGSVNKASLIKSFINIKGKEKDFLNTLLVFCKNFTASYWDLKRIYAMYEVQYEKTILSKQLYEESDLLQKNGAGDAVKVVLSLNNYQKDKITLNNIWNLILDLNEQIKNALGLLDLDLFIYPADDFQFTKVANTPKKYLQKMMTSHPIFLSLKINKQKNKINSQESDNANKSDINLNFKYIKRGVGLTSQQALDTFNITKLDDYSLGITWVYAFGKTAKSKKNEVVYQELKLNKEFSDARSNAFLAIKKRIRDLDSKRTEVNLLKKNISIVEKIFQREKFKYENGSSTSLALQEIQTQLVSSKFNLSTAQASYASIYNAMLVDTGEIFEKYNIPIAQLKKTP